MFLTPFDFVIKHRPRKTNPADGLSRIPNSKQAASGVELITQIQDRIVGETLPTQNRVEDIKTLNIQEIIGTKDLDADLEHNPGGHDSKFQFGLSSFAIQESPGSSTPTGTNTRRISTDN